VDRTNQADGDSEVILRVVALKYAAQTSIRHSNIAIMLDIYRHVPVNSELCASAHVRPRSGSGETEMGR
jgi:hypothetical protein